MVNLNDFKHAVNTLNQLVTQYPTAPEAEVAKREISRVQTLMKEKS